MLSSYVLFCNDRKLYTGCTRSLSDRLDRHRRGSVPATKNRRPVELAACFGFPNVYKTFEFEKYLKTGSGRAFQHV
ncbi:MAG: GIY-YIG nuclease family protein [Bacteroidetes bacterium]|nr:GIY-YIG nuclease family protein [Bacteroidota bacterium]